MGILGKDMFDMDRMYTNTRVEFGAAGYWVEEKVYPLPYGFVLTEILNMDVTPFQEALDELESVISQSHTEAVLGTFFQYSEMVWAAAAVPHLSVSGAGYRDDFGGGTFYRRAENGDRGICTAAQEQADPLHAGAGQGHPLRTGTLCVVFG